MGDTIQSESNFVYQIWFGNDVSPSTNTYPVVKTSQSANNSVTLHFDPNHNWPQSRVQFDGQLRYNPSGTQPTIIGSRVCAIDPSLTTTTTTATSTTSPPTTMNPE